MAESEVSLFYLKCMQIQNLLTIKKYTLFGLLERKKGVPEGKFYVQTKKRKGFFKIVTGNTKKVLNTIKN